MSVSGKTHLDYNPEGPGPYRAVIVSGKPLDERILSRWCPTGKRCLDGPLAKDEGFYCGQCQYWHRHRP